jgi:hypothetical protein
MDNFTFYRPTNFAYTTAVINPLPLTETLYRSFFLATFYVVYIIALRAICRGLPTSDIPYFLSCISRLGSHPLLWSTVA